jgi:multidrug efflux pump subunit AcrA (membrane-fusion protein)
MYVNVDVAPRSIANAIVVPTQAVQTGPDNRFIYVVGEDKKIVLRPVTLDYVEEGIAVVSGIKAGERIVIEGAQNVRPGSTVAEADRSGPDATKSGTREGKKKGA